MEKRPCTLFIDVDGCLVYHSGKLSQQILNKSVLLPNVKEKFDEWDKKGYYIVLTTGRKESMRSLTETQLTSLGLYWHQLIMGITGGTRIIINDLKPDSSKPTAVAINIIRNVGLGNVEIGD